MYIYRPTIYFIAMPANKENLANSYLSQMKDFFSKSARAGEQIDIEQEINGNPLFSKMLAEAPSVMLVFNFQTMVYDYFSPNLEKVFGYPVSQLKGLSGAEFAINMFYPDHLNILMQNNEVLNKYYFEYASLKRIQDTRASFTSKVKKSDGNYIWSLMQTMILEENTDGLPVRTISFITDITDIKTDNKVDFIFAIRNTKEAGYDTLYSTHYDGSEQVILSRREIEILNCFSKGMRTLDIADKLNISAHTVATHKKNILRKTGKENFVQLLA